MKRILWIRFMSFVKFNAILSMESNFLKIEVHLTKLEHSLNIIILWLQSEWKTIFFPLTTLITEKRMSPWLTLIHKRVNELTCLFPSDRVTCDSSIYTQISLKFMRWWNVRTQSHQLQVCLFAARCRWW